MTSINVKSSSNNNNNNNSEWDTAATNGIIELQREGQTQLTFKNLASHI